MPGFSGLGGGGGRGAANAKFEPRRKHRFIFNPPAALQLGVQSTFVKSATRPKLSIKEIQTKYNQETSYWDGQHEWDPVTVVWYDMETADSTAAILKWAELVVSLPAGNGEPNAALPSQYKGNAEIELTSANGKLNGKWTLYNAWPKEVDWQELDYSDSAIQLITTVIRFDRAQFEEFFAGPETEPQVAPTLTSPAPVNPANSNIF